MRSFLAGGPWTAFLRGSHGSLCVEDTSLVNSGHKDAREFDVADVSVQSPSAEEAVVPERAALGASVGFGKRR
jgi:hypothetical protein